MKKPGRREWLRASLQKTPDKGVCAVKFPWDGSGILSSMVASDGFVELSEATTKIKKGDMIDFLPFSEVMK